MSPPRAALLAGLAFVSLSPAALAPAAQAAERYIYSYDPASPAAKALTETGLSFEFEKGMIGGVRVRKIIQTGEFGSAELKPASDGELGKGGLAAALDHERPTGPLYEIMPKGEGKSFIHAVCPGADRAWLLIGRLDRFRDLTVQAVGRKASDAAAHACPSLAFSFRSDLRLPGTDVPDARLLRGSGP